MGYVIETPKGIEINDKVYPCDPGDQDLMHSMLYHFPKIAEKLDEGKTMEKDLAHLVTKAKAHGENLESDIDELRDKISDINLAVIEKSIEFIRGSLGDDVYHELYDGQRVNRDRLFNLCLYIYEWSIADRQDVIEQYIDPPNREGRRAVEKKAGKKGASKKEAAQSAPDKAAD